MGIESYGTGPEQHPLNVPRELSGFMEDVAREQSTPPFLQESWRGSEGALIFQGIEVGEQFDATMKAHSPGATAETVEITYDYQKRDSEVMPGSESLSVQHGATEPVPKLSEPEVDFLRGISSAYKREKDLS